MIVIYSINFGNKGFIEEYQLNHKKYKEFTTRVEQAAKYLLNEQLPYEDLCWELAEFQLIYEKGHGKYDEHDVRKKAKTLYEISPSYREICLIIATYREYLTDKKLYP